MRVLVLGGGVAGLSCALALIRRGQLGDVRVLERETEDGLRHKVGHGLLLMQNGVKALGALDAAHILNGSTPLRRAIIQDGGGTVLHADACDDVYCITRARIIDGLRAALPPEAILLDHDCDHVDIAPSRDHRRGEVRALRVRGRPPITQEAFDLVIGADGWRSSLYEALNPGHQRPHSRVREIVTSSHMPALAAQIGNVFIKTMFPDQALAFGLLAPSAERVIGFLQFDAERHGVPASRASPSELRAFVTRLMQNAPEPVPSYLAAADFDTAHLWSPPNADLPPRLACANAILVGDAAHPLLPFTSQGVSAALEDAVMLADRLTALADNPAALPSILQSFGEDRANELKAYVEGGRRILASFVDTARGFAVPYVDGAVSNLESYLAIPEGYLRNLFQVLDADGDGHLGREEFYDAMDLFEHHDVGRAERDALFDEMDTRGDGRLDVTEVLAALGGDGPASPLLQRLRLSRTPRRVALYDHRRRVADLFRLLDHDRDGAVDFEDFSVAAAMEGVVLPEAALRQRFDALDLDCDGRVSLPDVVGMMAPADGAPSLGRLVKADDRSAAPQAEDDPLFAASRVDLATLRARAWNYRWATQPEGVIPLTAADPDFPVADEITDALRDYLRPGYLPYGPAEGLPELRNAAAKRFRERRRIDCRTEQILVTNSAASALYLVAQCTLDEGDEALVADPCDFLFERSVAAAGGVVRRYPLHARRGNTFDLREVEALITPRTKLLTICNPHNPLGRVWHRIELEALANLAIRHDLWIMSDEVWADIVFPPNELTSVASLSPEIARRTFTVYGFSKGYGLAGLRVGLVVSPDADAHAVLLTHSHAADTAYGVSTLSQAAALAAFERADGWLSRYVTHLGRMRDHAVARLNRMPGVHCHTPEGTFVVFPDVSSFGLDAERIAERLRDDHKIAVVPGSPAFFGPAARGHLRLSIATSRRILDDGLDRIEQGLKALRGSRAVSSG